MAVRPRLHWWFDGTRAWEWSISTNSLGTEFTKDQIKKVDGELPGDIGWDSNFAWGIQFPDFVQIHSIGLTCSTTNPGVGSKFKVDISDQDSPQWDDASMTDWTNVIDSVYSGPTGVNQIFSCSQASSAKWIRGYGEIGSMGVFAAVITAFHLYGEYCNPRFEFCNTSGTEFTTEYNGYPLAAFPSAPNIQTYSEHVDFKVRNLYNGAASASFDAVVREVDYDGDTLISQCFKLSYSGGTKAGSLSITNLASGSLSETIEVWADITPGQNPADGYHYFVVDVSQIG